MPLNARRAMVCAVMFSAGLFGAAISPAVSLAEEPVCPYGTYWNAEVGQCLPIGVDPVVGPAGPVGVGGVVGPVGVGPVGPGPIGPGPIGPGGPGPR